MKDQVCFCADHVAVPTKHTALPKDGKKSSIPYSQSKNHKREITWETSNKNKKSIMNLEKGDWVKEMKKLGKNILAL